MLSPVTGLVCHRRLALLLARLDTSVGASGPHDFAVRVGAIRQRRRRVHRIPPPTFVTIAKRPSEEAGPNCYIADLAPSSRKSSENPKFDRGTLDPSVRRLKVGKGYIENVTPEMWAYEVSGKQVLWNWFSYRRRDRSRPIIGDRRPLSPLDSIQPEGWLPEYTTDLLDLLHVLGRLIALEPAQADLLNRICAGPLRSTEELSAAGALAIPEAASPKPKGKSKS